MDWTLLTRVMAAVVTVTLVIQYILQAIGSSRQFPANEFEAFLRENGEKSKDVAPDSDWMAARQGSMGSGRSKVVVFSYMRGGSTLFSDVFNIDPESTILWYEALDAFHAHHSGLPFYSNPLRLLYHRNLTRRTRDRETVEEMTEYLADLLDCRVSRLPIESVAHRFVSVSKSLKPFWKCMKTNDPMTLYTQRKRSADLCHRMDFEEEEEEEEDGEEEWTPKQRFDCRTTLRFLRRVKDSKTEKKRTEEEVFRLFLDEMGVSSDACVGIDGSGQEANGQEEEEEEEARGSLNLRLRRCQGKRFLFGQLFAAVDSAEKFDEKTRFCRDILDSICRRRRRRRRNEEGEEEEDEEESHRLVVVGIHRASFADLEPLIRRMPEALQVVFYVRDPRAIAVSRSDPLTNQTFVVARDWTALNESTLLCRRMLEDIAAAAAIGRRYPGSTITLRYEDLVDRPREVIGRLYAAIGRKVPEGFDRWVNETMTSPTYDGIYGIRRRNAREHVTRWRSKVTAEERRTMTADCIRVLQLLGYEHNDD